MCASKKNRSPFLMLMLGIYTGATMVHTYVSYSYTSVGGLFGIILFYTTTIVIYPTP